MKFALKLYERDMGIPFTLRICRNIRKLSHDVWRSVLDDGTASRVQGDSFSWATTERRQDASSS